MQHSVTPTRALTSTAYSVGDLVVDTARASVSRNGAEIQLPRLSFNLLIALIEAAPAVVSLDELMTRVWPGVVVNHETVSQRVKLLRDAIDDDPKSPRYITAVRGRGYRLVASVQPLTSADGAVEQGGSPRPRIGSRLKIIAGALVIAALAGFAFWHVLRDVHAQRVQAPASGAGRSIAVLPFESLSTAQDGELLAFGIPEAILHQLANIPQLLVIARTSSFALGGGNEDAREVGRKLGARFLLEGSVQRDARRLRITAQLVDSQTGVHVWSMRFDRTPQDVFAMQDEIALQVARALQLSLDPAVIEKLTGSGTANFDAYLAYLRGRAVMAKWRVADLGDAITHFSQAIRLDPAFAPAYVELAVAEVRQAEFEVTDDRKERFEAALQRGTGLIDRALQLDARNGVAYVERAGLKAYTDLADAESDYRHGLGLSPNYARGYAGLAAVLYEDPRRRDEALLMLDRARKLDPLEPAHDVTKAVFLLYGRSDRAGAQALLTDVLKRDPLNQPALVQLGAVYIDIAEKQADAVRLLEQALALDPLSEWTRQLLMRTYLTLGDIRAARQVASEASHPLAVREIPLDLYAHEWRRAGEAAYAAVDSQTNSPLDEPTIAAAIRLHARATRNYKRAVEVLEDLAGVTWDAAGRAVLPESLDLKAFPVALADVLQLSGDQQRARAVLEATLAAMDREARELNRGDLWYLHQRPIALVLLGRKDAAIDVMRLAVERDFAHEDSWLYFEIEPTLAALADDARFIQLRDTVRASVAGQKRRLSQLRDAGLVPQRQ